MNIANGIETPKLSINVKNAADYWIPRPLKIPIRIA
jgi:hypothetical protein